MKIAFVLHFYDKGMEARSMVRSHYSTVCIMEALAKLGHEVHVFYRFDSHQSFIENGVNYHFIKDKLPGYLKPWHIAINYNKQLAKKIKELGLEIVHANNIYRPIAHNNLAKRLYPLPYIVQDHGGMKKVKYPWIQRPFLSTVDLFLLSAKGMELPILEAKLCKPAQIRFVMEASSEMSFVSDNELSLQGKPCFLWIGNLNANKDPMTVVKAFKEVAKVHPASHLHMIYKQTFLEEGLKHFIAVNKLETQISLYGFIDRGSITKYLSTADYFVAASHKEGSGYALMEAMSCGLIPILTEIPSFKELTKEGSIGYLYPVADVDALAKIMVQCCAKEEVLTPDDKQQIIQHFTQYFSYEALASQLVTIYNEAIKTKA